MNLKPFTFLLTAVLLTPLLLLGCTLQNTSELEERIAELEEKLAEKKAKETEEEKSEIEEEEPVELEVIEEEDDMVNEGGTAEGKEVEDESAGDRITEQVEEEIESEPEEVQEPEQEQEVVDAEPVEEESDEERMDEPIEKGPERMEDETQWTKWDSVWISADESLSGLVTAGGTIRHGTSPILIGDTTVGTAMKGYLSFDIRRLHGKNVTHAELHFGDLEYYNDPESVSDTLITKVFDYGDSLDSSDFAVGGDTLGMYNFVLHSVRDITISRNPVLEDSLQKVLDDWSRDYFQLKLGLGSTTNGDNKIDALSIPDCGEQVKLYITYWYSSF